MIGFTTLITTVVGTAIGAFKEIWTLGQRAKIEERKALMAKAGLTIDDRQDARKVRKPFQFTRRIIVLSFMAILLTPVYLVIQNPNVRFNIPVQFTEGGFSFFFGLFTGEPVTGVKYIQVYGYVYLLSLLDMVGFIVGFYFGSSGTQARY